MFSDRFPIRSVSARINTTSHQAITKKNTTRQQRSLHIIHAMRRTHISVDSLILQRFESATSALHEIIHQVHEDANGSIYYTESKSRSLSRILSNAREEDGSYPLSEEILWSDKEMCSSSIACTGVSPVDAREKNTTLVNEREHQATFYTHDRSVRHESPSQIDYRNNQGNSSRTHREIHRDRLREEQRELFSDGLFSLSRLAGSVNDHFRARYHRMEGAGWRTEISAGGNLT